MKSNQSTAFPFERTCFEKAYLTVADIRSYLNISSSAAYELTHRKDFPVAYFGSSIRIPTGPFLAWVEQRTKVPNDLNRYLIQREQEVLRHAG